MAYTPSLYKGALALHPSMISRKNTIELIQYYYDDLDTHFRINYGYSFWSPIWGFPDAFHIAPDVSSDPLINQNHFSAQ